MRNSLASALAILAAVVGTAPACRPPVAEVRIGFPFPQNPRIASLAQETIDAWHAAPAIRIETVTRDTQAEGLGPDVAAAERLVLLPHLAGVVGHSNTRTTLTAGPVYAEAGVPLIVPAATSRLLQAVSPWIFPLAPDEEVEGEYLVRFATERLGARRITVVYRHANEYTQGLRDAVAHALAQRSLEPADTVGVLEDSDFDRVIRASIARVVPDAVILATGSPEAVPVARAFCSGAPEAPLIGGDSASLPRVLAAGLEPDCARHFHAAELWHHDLPRDESRAFVSRWRREPGALPSPSEVMHYDGLVLLAKAIREVGPDRASIRRYLRELGRSRPPFEGVSGPISFTSDRPVNLVMTRLDGQAVVLVEEFR